MKKLLLIAGVAALWGCMQKPGNATETATAPVENAAASPAVATGESPTTAPGDYDVKMADGTMATTTINADGTYVDTGPDGKQVKGKFANKNGTDCFDPDGDEPEMCWTVEKPAADGSFKAKSVDGKMEVTVSPKKS